MDKTPSEKILAAASELEAETRLFLSKMAEEGWSDDDLRKGADLVAYAREVEKALTAELSTLT